MKTEIVCVVDRSGSMDIMVKEAIGGFNGFLNDQKAVPDPANFTLVLFDHEYRAVYESKDIADIPPMDELQFQPRGTTALLDAMGRAITETKERIDAELKKLTDAGYKGEKPKVIVMVMTDGLENASKDWDRTRISNLIEQRKKDGWEFLFMSANMDGIQDAHSYGIDANNIVGVANSGKAYLRGMNYASANVASYRTGGTMKATNNLSYIGDTEEEDEKK